MITTNTASSSAALHCATHSAELNELATQPPRTRVRKTQRKQPASQPPGSAGQLQSAGTWADIPLKPTKPSRDPLTAQIRQQVRTGNVTVGAAVLAPVIDFPAPSLRNAKKSRRRAVKAAQALQAAGQKIDGPKSRPQTAHPKARNISAKATPDAATMLLREREKEARESQAKTARKSGSNFQHDRDRKGGKTEWITPPHVISALGLQKFDLDPCSPTLKKRLLMPPELRTAKTCYSIDDDGLSREWFGRVYCNPPYGLVAREWLEKCAQHNNCIALLFGRTETWAFQDFVWEYASGLLFVYDRLKFFHVDGTQGGSAGAPSVLVAYGKDNAALLKNCILPGAFLKPGKQRPRARLAAALAAARRTALKESP